MDGFQPLKKVYILLIFFTNNFGYASIPSWFFITLKICNLYVTKSLFYFSIFIKETFSPWLVRSHWKKDPKESSWELLKDTLEKSL